MGAGTRLAHQQVLGLDVAVHDVQAVQVLDGAGQVVQHPAGVPLRVLVRGSDGVKQVSSLRRGHRLGDVPGTCLKRGSVHRPPRVAGTWLCPLARLTTPPSLCGLTFALCSPSWAGFPRPRSLRGVPNCGSTDRFQNERALSLDSPFLQSQRCYEGACGLYPCPPPPGGRIATVVSVDGTQCSGCMWGCGGWPASPRPFPRYPGPRPPGLSFLCFLHKAAPQPASPSFRACGAVLWALPSQGGGRSCGFILGCWIG